MLAAFSDLLDPVILEMVREAQGDFDALGQGVIPLSGGQRRGDAAEGMEGKNADRSQCDGDSRTLGAPAELSLPFSFSGKTVEIRFRRIDSDDYRIAEFRSEGTPLLIHLSLDLVQRRMSVRVTFDYFLGNTVSDCLDAASLALEMLKGTVKVKGVKWPVPTFSDEDGKRTRETYEFWDRVKKIEDILGVSFCPSKRMSTDDAAFLVRVFEGIVNGGAVGLGYRPESVTYIDNEGSKLPLNTKMMLVVPQIERRCIMGAMVEVRANIGLSAVTLRVLGERGNEIEYGLTYDEDYLCTVLYTPVESTDDSPESINTIKEALLAPLPNGEHY